MRAPVSIYRNLITIKRLTTRAISLIKDVVQNEASCYNVTVDLSLNPLRPLKIRDPHRVLSACSLEFIDSILLFISFLLACLLFR